VRGARSNAARARDETLSLCGSGKARGFGSSQRRTVS